jgi:hypothetical protein
MDVLAIYLVSVRADSCFPIGVTKTFLTAVGEALWTSRFVSSSPAKFLLSSQPGWQNVLSLKLRRAVALLVTLHCLEFGSARNQPMNRSHNDGGVSVLVLQLQPHQILRKYSLPSCVLQ